LQAGLWSLPSAVGFIVGAMLTPVIVRRVRPAFAMAEGLAWRPWVTRYQFGVALLDTAREWFTDGCT
jgi:hypothetical protein